MEFVNTEKNTIVEINNTGSEIIINNVMYPITNSPVFTKTEGKLYTMKHLIKYSKGTLYLYDKGTNNIIDVYTKNKQQQFSIQNTVIGDTLVNKFILKDGYIIILVINNNNEYIMITEITTKGGKGVTTLNRYNVSNMYKIGLDFVYETEIGKLQIGYNRNSKFNGIPIGKLL